MSDYNQRLIKEYSELKERAGKLDVLLKRWADGSLEFNPMCSIELLTAQLHIMHSYLSILEERGRIEGVEFEDDGEYVRIQDCREGDPTPRILKVRRTDVWSH